MKSLTAGIRIAMAASTLLSLPVSGCARRGTGSVLEGVVTLDGQPLRDVDLFLEPMDGRAEPPLMSFAASDERGLFCVKTHGGVRGRHRIIVIPYRYASAKADAVIPPRYQDAATTPLVAVLPASGMLRVELVSE